MKLLEQIGLVIFSFGFFTSITLYAQYWGAQVHPQSSWHSPLSHISILELLGLDFFLLTIACIPAGIMLILLKKNTASLKLIEKSVVIVILITLVVAGSAASFGLVKDNSRLNYLHEKIAVSSAFYNNTQNSVSVNAQATNDYASNITIDGIVIKDAAGNVVAPPFAPIPNKLNGLELTTITAHLNSTLNPGIYSATLITARGGAFVSPSFTVP